MRLLNLFLLGSFLCVFGCSHWNVRPVDETPENPSDYSALFFSSPTTDRVLVSSVTEHSALLGDRGFGVNSNYGVATPEPLWLWPGWVQVTYACSSAKQAFHTATIGLSRTGKYYLHCSSHDKLLVSRAEP